MRTCTYFDRRRREACTECGKTIDLCPCKDPDELAYYRNASPIAQFLKAADSELGNYPRPTHLFEELVLAIGNLGEKLIRHDQTRDPPSSEIYQTLARIAAISARLATDGTDEYAYPAD